MLYITSPGVTYFITGSLYYESMGGGGGGGCFFDSTYK